LPGCYVFVSRVPLIELTEVSLLGEWATVSLNIAALGGRPYVTPFEIHRVFDLMHLKVIILRFTNKMSDAVQVTLKVTRAAMRMLMPGPTN
jgi:hypothetical protein